MSSTLPLKHVTKVSPLSPFRTPRRQGVRGRVASFLGGLISRGYSWNGALQILHFLSLGFKEDWWRSGRDFLSSDILVPLRFGYCFVKLFAEKAPFAVSLALSIFVLSCSHSSHSRGLSTDAHRSEEVRDCLSDREETMALHPGAPYVASVHESREDSGSSTGLDCVLCRGVKVQINPILINSSH